MTTVNWTNVTEPIGMLQQANVTTGGWFWTGMLAMLWAILLISMLPFGFEAALLAASFGAFMVGIIMAYMGIVAWTWVVMALGMIIGMILWIMYSRND